MRRILSCSQSLTMAVGLVVWGAVSVVPAMAATITYNFGGNVTFVGNNLTPPSPTPFNTGALNNMTGTMTVNTSDGNLGGVVGTYTIQSLNLQIGNYNATFVPGGGAVTVRNGAGNGAGADRFLVTADVDGPSAGNRLPGAFTINLRGPSSIFSSDALPNPAPSVSSFVTRNVFRLQFGSGNGDGRAVIGSINSLTAVPLPAGVVLFGVGLVALIGLGAGGLRNIRLPRAS